MNLPRSNAIPQRLEINLFLTVFPTNLAVPNKHFLVQM